MRSMPKRVDSREAREIADHVADRREREPHAVFGGAAPHQRDDDMRPAAEKGEERRRAERAGAAHSRRTSRSARAAREIARRSACRAPGGAFRPRVSGSVDARPRPPPRCWRSRGEQEDRLPSRKRCRAGRRSAAPTIGATTITVATRPIIDAARSRSNRSRMMARPTTMPVEAPSACSMRAAIRLPTVPTEDRQHARGRGEREPGQQHRPAAEAVGQRPEHELRDRERRADRARP